MGSGCEKSSDNLWTISPDSQSASIHQEVDGVEFTFSLLNEKGEPATVFNEGENFSFYFAIVNKSGNKLYFDPDFAYYNDNDFCKVYSSEREDLGKPFRALLISTVGAGAYPFNTNESRVFEQQWVDNRDSIWSWEKATYESTHRPYLKKGNYYTGFKHRFRFPGEHPVYTDTLTFKINFKVE
ncbi:hypothetical protein SD074_20260 [Prolixibacter sp. SD074]|nr:hypothetical protein SD074_20260 [Prolixibacter sp. SD074]